MALNMTDDYMGSEVNDTDYMGSEIDPEFMQYMLYMEGLVDATKFYIEGVGILAIGSVGLVINAFALCILCRQQVGILFEWHSIGFRFHEIPLHASSAV